MRRQSLLSGGLFLVTAALVANLSGGCGDDTGTGGSGGGGPCAGADTTGCTIALSPSEDDTTTLQTELINASSGAVVCLCPGTYSINNELSASTVDLTIRGVGATRDDVVLDFAQQVGGDDGLTSTGDGFVVENFTVKNSPGNGIVVDGVDGVTFRNIKVSWDAGSVEENGAYAVYPVSSTNVLVEDCEIVGASDAGIYVGQSQNIIVRNNDVYANVAGIEIENSTDAEVYNNRSYDNSAGILVFSIPQLSKKDSLRADVHHNEIYDNNRDNFGTEGSIVSAVPIGLGILVLATDETHIHDNDIHDNATGGIVMVSTTTFGLLVDGYEPDPETDPDPETTYVYGNTFTNNGTDPSSPLDAIGVVPLEDFVWDGEEKTEGSANICLSMSPPSFRDVNGIGNISDTTAHSTDTTPHECDFAPLAPIELP